MRGFHPRRARLDEVFSLYRPQVVLHAAAHKHVPLMEHNCAEAVKNNVFGTLNMVNTAEKYGVVKFIMISTDKAVNPTNVMGATKRMCEMIVQSRTGSRHLLQRHALWKRAWLQRLRYPAVQAADYERRAHHPHG